MPFTCVCVCVSLFTARQLC